MRSFMSLLHITRSTVPIFFRPIRSAIIPAVRHRDRPHPPLADSPPVVIPSASSLSPDAAAPQIAARPPAAPKAEKLRPKIRSTKAALTIVGFLNLVNSRLINSIAVDTCRSV